MSKKPQIFNINKTKPGQVNTAVDLHGKPVERAEYLFMKYDDQITFVRAVYDDQHFLYQNTIPVPDEDIVTKYNGKLPENLQGHNILCTCGIEGERPSPSYTIDTVLELKKRHPDCAFTLLLGDDSAEAFPRWHRIKELLTLVTIAIGKRKAGIETLQGEYIPTPLYEISATDIRERLREKKFCGHLLPQVILDYIFKHKIYS